MIFYDCKYVEQLESNKRNLLYSVLFAGVAYQYMIFLFTSQFYIVCYSHSENNPYFKLIIKVE